jgi:hypothetical protein
MRVICQRSGCGASGDIPGAAYNQQVQCPSCGTVFTLIGQTMTAMGCKERPVFGWQIYQRGSMTFSSETCTLKGCRRAAVLGSKYCCVHGRWLSRVRQYPISILKLIPDLVSICGERLTRQVAVVKAAFGRIHGGRSGRSTGPSGREKPTGLIRNVRLFCEPPAGHEGWMNPDNWWSTGPPLEFFPRADSALQLNGKLVAYIEKYPVFLRENIDRLDDTEVKRFFSKKTHATTWEIYFASTESGVRYNLLIEYDPDEYYKHCVGHLDKE